MTTESIVVSENQNAQDFFRYDPAAGNLMIAKRYIEGGINIIPIKADASKAPCIKWGDYQEKMFGWGAASKWFTERNNPHGMSALCGMTSGGADGLGLEILDFDNESEWIYPVWCEEVEKACPGLLSRLTIIATPTPGRRQLWFRSTAYGRSQKLAMGEAYIGENGRETQDVLIESKGQGGYGLAPGSPGSCHRTGGQYTVLQGDPSAPAVITPEERKVLFDEARHFDKSGDEAEPEDWERVAPSAGTPGGEDLPGSDFNRTATWDEILMPHDWTKLRPKAGIDYWKRPGKADEGNSATTGVRPNGLDLLKVFTSSAAPLKPGKGMTKFRVYTLLNHGGDFRAAASELAKLGYGKQTPGQWYLVDDLSGHGIVPFESSLPVNRVASYFDHYADEDRADPDIFKADPVAVSTPATPAPAATKANEDEPKKEKKAASTLMVELVRDKCDLWHTGTGEGAVGYLTLLCGGHWENHPVRSATVKRLMLSWFLDRHGKAPGETAVREAVNTLDAVAIHKGENRATYLRTARTGETILVDLGDKAWRCVSITASGWEVVPHPVAFIRPDNFGELPLPVEGGTIADLRRFVQADDNDFKLLVGWLLDALKGDGPYHVAVLNGEQGSAKSTTLSVLRDLVDPVVKEHSDKAREPRDERDLALEAAASHCVSFDNLSKLPQWLSDAFCRIATGGALTTRKLYEDEALKRFTFKRPLILTGIENFVVAGDLASRSLILDLPHIPAESRMLESQFWAAFRAAKPLLLGVLFDALSHGLRTEVTLEKLPRMADSYLWVAKCAGGLGWSISDWATAYDTNREGITESILEGDKTACLLRGWFAGLKTSEVKVAPEDLLAQLRVYCNKSHGEWLGYIPQSTKKLANVITRLAPYLRASGLEVDRGRSGKGRSYVFRRSEAAVGGPADG